MNNNQNPASAAVLGAKCRFFFFGSVTRAYEGYSVELR